MENKDFDKIFAHKFNQLTGEPYREEGWADVSARMDAYERRRRRWMFPVLLPLFGLLAAGNVFWWHQWRQATHQSADPVIWSKTDTIIRTNVVYRYDTIYQNTLLVRRYGAGDVIATTNVGRSENSLGKLSTAKNTTSDTQATQQQPIVKAPYSTKTNGLFIADRPETGSGQNIINKQLTQQNPAEAGHTSSHRVPLSDSLSQTTQASTEPAVTETDSAFEYLLNNPPVMEKVRKPLLRIARPRLGVSLGWGNPLLNHKRSGSMFGAGVGADVEIAKNIRLGADLHYWQGTLKADETGELHGVEIPNPGADYKLRYWETYRIPAVTYSVQLRYLFPLENAWTPWIGIGTQGATFLPFEIEFDFENQNNQLEIFLPGQAGAVNHWRGITLSAGVERKLSPHFSFGAEGFLLRHVGKNPGILDHQIGLKTRLYYNF